MSDIDKELKIKATKFVFRIHAWKDEWHRIKRDVRAAGMDIDALYDIVQIEDMTTVDRNNRKRNRQFYMAALGMDRGDDKDVAG